MGVVSLRAFPGKRTVDEVCWRPRRDLNPQDRAERIPMARWAVAPLVPFPCLSADVLPYICTPAWLHPLPVRLASAGGTTQPNDMATLESSSGGRPTRAVDVGCADGRRMDWAAQYDMVFGIDIARDPMTLAHRNVSHATFIQARAERMPFRDDSFDAVGAWVSLPYMDIPATLREFNRILRPGGRLFISLHRARLIFHWWRRDLLEFNWKGALFYQPYVFVNGLLLQFGAGQFRFPFNRNRIESYQTKHGIERLLIRSKFADVEFPVEGRRFLVTATKDRSRAAEDLQSGTTVHRVA